MDDTQEQSSGRTEGLPHDPEVTLTEARAREIIENMSDALYAVDEHWHITYVNRKAKAEEIWGTRREDLPSAFARADDGQMRQIIGVTQDVTERKHAEKERSKQQEILQTIFDHIPVMIRFVGADGRLQLINRVYERTLGWTIEEIQQQNLDIFAESYPEPQERQRVLNFIAAATGEWADFKTRARDGRVIDTAWASVHLSE